jgi:DNA invertase Pin-like site-specific DNA recombinase
MWQFDKYSNTFIPGVLPADNGKITACYTRLSQEDEGTGDSDSILNQRALLLKYCADHQLENVRFFSDDGWSGTNFVEVR